MTTHPDFVTEAIREAIRAQCEGRVEGGDCPYPDCACDASPEVAVFRAGMEAAAKIADEQNNDAAANSRAHTPGWRRCAGYLADIIRTEAAKVAK